MKPKDGQCPKLKEWEINPKAYTWTEQKLPNEWIRNKIDCQNNPKAYKTKIIWVKHTYCSNNTRIALKWKLYVKIPIRRSK